MDRIHWIVIASLFAPGCGGSGGSNDDDAGGDSEVGTDTPADMDTNGDAGIDTDPFTRERVFGVTVTNPWVATTEECDLTAALDGLVGTPGRSPTARVVFDEGVDRIFLTNGLDASAYVIPAANIGRHAIVMGELLDSFYVDGYDIAQYRARACEYRSTLGHLVDIWEIGNEINGEWLGDELMSKLVAAWS